MRPLFRAKHGASKGVADSADYQQQSVADCLWVVRVRLEQQEWEPPKIGKLEEGCRLVGLKSPVFYILL